MKLVALHCQSSSWVERWSCGSERIRNNLFCETIEKVDWMGGSERGEFSGVLIGATCRARNKKGNPRGLLGRSRRVLCARTLLRKKTYVELRKAPKPIYENAVRYEKTRLSIGAKLRGQAGTY